MRKALRRLAGSGALLLAASLVLAGPVAAQNPDPSLWLRPHIGLRDGGWTPGVFGLGLEVALGHSAAIVGTIERWAFDTACPAESPSTCGDDGWAVTTGIRLTGPLKLWVAELLLEPQIGAYRFVADGRKGHTTLSLGGRYGFSFPFHAVRLDVANAVRHVVGYDRGRLAYPSESFSSFQVAVALGIR